MSLPTILPTGSMSSEEYCEYMVGYNNAAADHLYEELGNYVTQSTINDWEDMWIRVISDVEGSVTTLEESVAKLKAQVAMAADAIDKI
jgi:hypothetical protein